DLANQRHRQRREKSLSCDKRGYCGFLHPFTREGGRARRSELRNRFCGQKRKISWVRERYYLTHCGGASALRKPGTSALKDCRGRTRYLRGTGQRQTCKRAW